MKSIYWVNFFFFKALQKCHSYRIANPVPYRLSVKQCALCLKMANRLIEKRRNSL